MTESWLSGKRARAVLAAFAVLPIIFAGCNASRKKVIGVVPKGTSHLFWVSVQAGALKAGQDFNVEILWNGPAQETEYDRQVQILDSLRSRE